VEIKAIMLNDLALVFLSLIFVLSALLVSVFLRRKVMVSSDKIRKAAHVLTGAWAFLWLFFSSRWAAVFVCLAVTLGAIIVAVVSKRSKAVNKIVTTFTGGDEVFIGLIFHAISLSLITFFLWNQKAVGTGAILALTLGDGMAGIVGGKFGRHTYQFFRAKRKSLEGSLACFLFSFSGIFFGLALVEKIPLSPLVLASLSAAGAVTIIEAVSPRHTDNLTVPLGAVAVLGLLTKTF